MEWQHYGATFCTAAECRAPRVELLDDEPARRHDFLHDILGRILFSGVCILPLGLRFTQVAGGNLQNARNQFSGGLSSARRCFVVDFPLVPRRLGTSDGGFRLFVLQRIRLWRLLDDGTSRMVDPCLAGHYRVFVVPTSVGIVA